MNSSLLKVHIFTHCSPKFFQHWFQLISRFDISAPDQSDLNTSVTSTWIDWSNRHVMCICEVSGQWLLSVYEV